MILLSLDGFAAQRHQKLLTSSAYKDPDGLQRFAREGMVAHMLVPPNPTLTAVSHTTLATGRQPQDHGIVGNRFHLPGTPLGATVSGFEHPWQTESLWAAVRRQGRKVGVVTFPGCDGSSPERSADFFMVYVNQPLARPRWVELAAQGPDRTVNLEVSMKTAGGEETLVFPMVIEVAPEKGGNQRIVINVAGEERVVGVGEWFPLTVTRPHPDGGKQTIGAWCLLKEVRSQPPGVVLYQGGFYAVQASPRSFRELVEGEAGFWPGPPDDQALFAGLSGKPGLSLQEYGQQLERFSRFFTDATVAAVRHMDADLILTYQPVVDEAQHALLLTDPRQPAFTADLAEASARFLDWTYQVADRAVGGLTRACDLSRDAVVVVSDHGIHPVWAQVNLQALLAQHGWCSYRDGDRPLLSPDCRLWAVQGGGVAHLYVNLSSKDPTGVREVSARHKLLLDATAALARVEVDGTWALEAVAPQERADRWGLAHPNSGDLVVFAKPGVGLGGRFADPLLAAPPYAGMHGYLNHHSSMAGVFFARGAGVPRRSLSKVQATQVAPFVAGLLGLEAPGR